MKMCRLWRQAPASALLFAGVAAQAQLASDTPCADLGVQLQGIPEAAGARCVGGGDYGDEFIDASVPGATFVIRHQRSLPNYYLGREEVTSFVKRLAAGGKLQDVGEAFEVGEFDVVRYRTAAAGAEAPAACFLFLNYAGHVAHTTGYRHAIIGNYCDESGHEPTDARIGELLGAIDADFW